ncbi:hypothetical protein K9L67_01850 [Candidatus Woesearchaeota archaeon]|nr:hypothetical protein [Candidatus Woesearchaeota archaeon]MCF7900948.1 hypothetical protein [Candidatus Woesearchaeota archaeon]MCF8013606.1 hypothetical protein [Candidatus Woesearchaeota archaeon]
MSEKKISGAAKILIGSIGGLIFYKPIWTFFSKPRNKIFTAAAITGLFVATQCQDEIRYVTGFAKDTIKQTEKVDYLEDSLKTINSEFQEFQNKYTVEQSFARMKLYEQKIKNDSLIKTVQAQNKKIVNLAAKNEVYETNTNKQLEKIMYKIETENETKQNLSAKLSGLTSQLEYLSNNDGTKTQLDSIYGLAKKTYQKIDSIKISELK